MASVEKLKSIALNLKNPEGEKGREMGEMMSVSNRKMICHSIDLLNITNNDNILELGHGNCKHLAYILKKAEAISYTGLEISQLMFDESCRMNRLNEDNRQITFKLYDGLNIPFCDNHFDKIFTVNTIYFWEDIDRSLFEIYRVLKPGGVFNITFGQENSMKKMPYTQFEFTLYSTDKVLEYIRETPFQIEEIVNDTEEIKNEVRYYMDREFTTISLKK